MTVHSHSAMVSSDPLSAAKALFLTGRHAEAAALCREALKAGQPVADCLILLGSIGTLTGASRASIPLLQLALSLAPDHISALNALGLAHFSVKDYDQACQYFEQILSNTPGRPEVMRNLAHAQYERKDWRKAQALFAQLFNRGEIAEKDWLPHAISLHHLKRHADAVVLLTRFLKLRPENAEAWYALGMCLYECQGASAAIYAYRKSIFL